MNTGRLSVVSVVSFLVAMVGVIGLVGPVPSALAATSPGQVYAFGHNDFGQLGNPDRTVGLEANPLPEPVALPGENGPVTQTAAGYGHSLVVTSTGQLYSFGENDYGQLGRTTNSGTGNANPVPTLVSLPSGSAPVTEVAAGTYFSLAVTSDGQLYSFGENEFGELGRATNDFTATPNPTPTLVDLPGATGPVTEVAAGAYFSLAVTSTGQLFAFGANERGSSARRSTTAYPSRTRRRPWSTCRAEAAPSRGSPPATGSHWCSRLPASSTASAKTSTGSSAARSTTSVRRRTRRRSW